MKKYDEDILIKDSDLIEIAIGNLKQYTGIKDAELIAREDDSGLYRIQINKKSFLCAVSPKMTSMGLMELLERRICARNKEVLLAVFRTSTSVMRKRCIELGINFLDVSGNCHVTIPGLFVHVEGIPSLLKEKKSDLSLRRQGMSLLLYLCTIKDNKLPLYKDLAQISDVSLGTVKNVVDGLMDGGFIFKSDRGLFLKNRIRLLETWATLYNQSQRNKMLLGRMTWRMDESKWSSVELPEGMFWGGECGAYLKNGYMRPASFCIYTKASISLLIKKGIMIPDPNGEVAIYKKFWNDEVSTSVPLAMLFADLIESGEGRCIEAANYLKEHDIQYLS